MKLRLACWCAFQIEFLAWWCAKWERDLPGVEARINLYPLIFTHFLQSLISFPLFPSFYLVLHLEDCDIKGQGTVVVIDWLG